MTESSIGGEQSPGRDRSRPRPVAGRRPAVGGQAASTSERILDAALASFATRGYEASSLDALAAGLDIRKQTILYWFPSKEVLLEAVIDRSAVELSAALEASLATAGTGWARVEAVVRSVFRLAARRPELLGPGPRDGPARARRRPPGWWPRSSRWCAGPRSSSRRRWTPATCAGTSPGCCCWPSTPR